MQTDTMIHVQPSVFTLNKKDIGELLRRLHLQVLAGSPFQTDGEGDETTVLPDTSEELLKDQVFVAALQVLAAPQRVVRVYAGGGLQPRGNLFMCIHSGMKEAPIVAVTPSFENSWVVLAFPETVQGIAWLLDTVGCNIEVAPQSPFPDTFTPEFLVYFFGIIDQYRRCSYENMLQHRSGETAPFTMEDFAANIKASLQSSDLRWALPALINLTPGFANLPLEPDTNVYAQLIDADVMLPVENSQGKLQFIFGEVGRDLGIEFLRSWIQSAGIEVSGISNGHMISEHRAFIACTMLANHLFELLPVTSGKQEVHYAPLSRNALGALLEEWILAEPGSTATADTQTASTAREATPQPEIKKLFCAHCGKPLLKAAQFCVHCGKAVI